MEMEDAFKVGCLFLPSQTFLRKTWPKKFCALYKASNQGIQRLEIFDNEDTYIKKCPSKLIPLTECIKVTVAPLKQQANVFEVCTKSNSYQFSADSFQEMTDWLSALQTVAFGSKHLPPAVNTTVQVVKEDKQEENLLYSSMDEPEVYSVNALGTGAVLRNGLQGGYNLIITSVNISIAEEVPQGRIGRIILTWPYRHIRRYGCSNNNFSFEAGRKCSSGEGLFTFATNDGTQIFQSVDSHVAALKSSHSEDVPNSPSLSDDKNSFFASKDSLTLLKDSSPGLRSVTDSDSSFGTVSRSQTEMLSTSFQNKPTSTKSSAPVKKPPRKSRPKTDSCQDFENSSLSAETLNVMFGTESNFYEELYENERSSQRRNSDLPHSTAENMKITEGEKINPITSQTPVYADIEGMSSNSVSALTEELKQVLYCNSDYFPTSDKPREKINFQSISNPVLDSSGYDHLLTNKSPASRLPNNGSGSDHIYGKLLQKQSVSTKSVINAYGSLQPKKKSIGSDSSPFYTNVQLPKPLSASAINSIEVPERDPDHFTKNDAEYAQVFKRNESVP